MEYGIFTSTMMEIAQTRFWTLCLSCNSEKSILSAELYNGLDGDKTLAAIVRRNNETNTTLYAYETPDGQVFTNDTDGVRDLIGMKYQYDTSGMQKNDTIQISEPYEMPGVSEKGIECCLKQWRMGTFYKNWSQNGMQFQLVTNKIEYIFMIHNENCDIYCGASINISCEEGLFGRGQYFRIRSYGDNSQPFCQFGCNLGKAVTLVNEPVFICESGTCTTTEQGIYWPIKRFSEDEIVLDGCGGEEYVYTRYNGSRSEYFTL